MTIATYQDDKEYKKKPKKKHPTLTQIFHISTANGLHNLSIIYLGEVVAQAFLSSITCAGGGCSNISVIHIRDQGNAKKKKKKKKVVF